MATFLINQVENGAKWNRFCGSEQLIMHYSSMTSADEINFAAKNHIRIWIREKIHLSYSQRVPHTRKWKLIISWAGVMNRIPSILPPKKDFLCVTIHQHNHRWSYHKLFFKHFVFSFSFENRHTHQFTDDCMVSRIHAEFEVILSYIRGRSNPLCAQAIRHDAIPIRAHRFPSGIMHITGLPANSSSVQSCLW